MSYVHFDLAEVEAAMREVRERSLPVALQSISSADTKVAMLAQDRFFEAGVAAQLEAVRLRNEGALGRVHRHGGGQLHRQRRRQCHIRLG
ncbi:MULTISPECIES: hypothetical protein [unclassified Marinovum]|uniref:hypothetical protein n=1 Tax=unclassified Marinovum TaxID=2647166 RepID=UPI003EDC9382